MKKQIHHYQLVTSSNKLDVPRGKTFIGSSPVCGIQLPAEEAEPFHAMLYWREETLFILDLKSPQGTYVDGAIISEAVVRHDSTLNIGSTAFVIQMTTTEEEVAEVAVTEQESVGDWSDSDDETTTAIFDAKDFEALESNHETCSEKISATSNSLQAILSYKNRIIDVQTLKLQKGTYFLRSMVKNDFDISAPFIAQDIEILSYDGSNLVLKTNQQSLTSEKPYILDENDFRLEIKLVHSEETAKILPWWKINPAEKKEFARNVSLMMIPFLFLLFVKLPEEIKESTIVAEVFEAPPKGVATDTEQGGGQQTETKAASAPAKSAFSTANLANFKSSSAPAMKTTDKADHSLNLATGTGNAGGSPSLVTGTGRGLSSGGAGVSSSGKGLGHKDGVNFNFQKTKTVVMGSMDPELLRKILQQYLPQFRHCYQIELAKNEELKGVIDLNFRIEATGKTSKIDIKSTSANFTNTGTGCMAKVLEIIPFPKPKGGGVVDVRQPLNFYSENG